MTNYYRVLQVQKGSNSEEIKNSFRRLVKKYHPDKDKTNGVSSKEKIKVLIEAYKTLTDSGKRFHYDKLLQNKNVNKSYNLLAIGALSAFAFSIAGYIAYNLLNKQ